MKRKIITIDPALCTGCGLCISACHEGALRLVDGKAKLVSDSHCDGLGDCLPKCPTGAMKIVEREADPFDEKATPNAERPSPAGCPGLRVKTLAPLPSSTPAVQRSALDVQSSLTNWPVQLKLVPVNAPYLKNAALLIAADCTAFAYADFHRRFMTGKVTLIGCPKLDAGDYAEKLTALLRTNDIRSITVLRMDVPCCAGIANATQQALLTSGKMIPWHIVTLSTDGTILEE